MRFHTGKTVIAALAVLALSLMSVPAAHASSISFGLTSNNLGLGANVGTVLISDTGTDQVTVTITMNAGFSLKLPGGDIEFNGPSGLTAGSVSGVQGSADMFSFYRPELSAILPPTRTSASLATFRSTLPT